MLARHIDQWCERKSCAHKRRCREERRKDGEKMSADECEENRPLALAFIAHTLFIHFFFSRYLLSFPLYLPPLSCSTSPPHITPISHSLPLSVFSKSHFLSHHLSPWLERLVLTVFIIPCLSSFDQEDSSQDLAAAAPNLARHI